MELAQRVVQKMLAGDKMSQWLGIAVDQIKPGYCRLHFTVRDEMLNGFNIVHGGVVFSAADSAFAFACNTHGRLSLALDVHINFMEACHEGDVLTVEAKEVHLGYKTGVYKVTVVKQPDNTGENEELVATFTGTAYRTSRQILDEDN
ncbi:MAG: hotdog fold thioesterase [Rhodothermales bacterium]